MGNLNFELERLPRKKQMDRIDPPWKNDGR
jgi:hypothetical protein